MNKKHPFNSQKGQALLIVVLVMVVALTVALSVALKSITNVQTSVDNENSQRAFSAAEAGIEKALKSGATPILEQNLGNGASIKQVTISDIPDKNVLLNNGSAVAKDDGADVWLVGHNTDGTINYTTPWTGNLTIYWGVSSSPCNDAAVEIILLSGSSADTAVSKRFAVDPCGTRGNNFNPPSSSNVATSVNSKGFPYKTDISVTSGILVRVIPIYYSTPLGAIGSIDFPSQGKRIESTGVAGNAQRKISFFQGYPKLPAEFFQYILFSGQ